uniref:SFRICE_022944 n=1 Tax=Spodoptera frugiperda TaxID=7108 RepID=A0A2H1VBP6_SPOFR
MAPKLKHGIPPVFQCCPTRQSRWLWRVCFVKTTLVQNRQRPSLVMIKKKATISIPCPKIIKDYNSHMGGVDLMDSF